MNSNRNTNKKWADRMIRRTPSSVISSDTTNQTDSIITSYVIIPTLRELLDEYRSDQSPEITKTRLVDELAARGYSCTVSQDDPRLEHLHVMVDAARYHLAVKDSRIVAVAFENLDVNGYEKVIGLDAAVLVHVLEEFAAIFCIFMEKLSRKRESYARKRMAILIERPYLEEKIRSYMQENGHEYRFHGLELRHVLEVRICGNLWAQGDVTTATVDLLLGRLPYLMRFPEKILEDGMGLRLVRR